jgi:3-isopropylmalate/(R)-2-methylmalate dehydratase small subunit
MAIEPIRAVRGTGLPLHGDNIDTDRIIPARFLKAVSFEGLEQHLFEDDVRQAEASRTTHAIVDPRFRGATILIVNRNFGCGSSREHAPQAIRRRGIRAVLGESFSEIFFGNSIALGMPCATGTRDHVAELQAFSEQYPEQELTYDVDRMTIAFGERTHPFVVPAAARESLLDGTWDATALLLDRFEDVERTARSLPYISGY